mgnify:CR=1 FL=1
MVYTNRYSIIIWGTILGVCFVLFSLMEKSLFTFLFGIFLLAIAAWDYHSKFGWNFKRLTG